MTTINKVAASRFQRGASGERKTTEALARLHSARSFNHSHCFTAEGWGSSLAPTGLRSFEGIEIRDWFDEESMEALGWVEFDSYSCLMIFNMDLFPYRTLQRRVEDKHREVREFLFEFVKKLPARLEALRKMDEED